MSNISNTNAYSTLPKWLDDIFIQKCLQQKYSGQEVIVHNFTTSAATAKGENFLSDLIRVSVNYSNADTESKNAQTLSLIIKVECGDPNVLESISFMNLYGKEMDMYEIILPKIKSLLERYGEYEKMFPDPFAVKRENGAIVFEDLAVNDYSICKTKFGYDMEHAQQILIKLAKFHAANAILEEEYAEDYQQFRKGS